MRKYFIGLGGSMHDFATCVIDENANILLGIEDERLSKIRHGLGEKHPCSASFHYCLDNLGLREIDIQAICGNDMLSPFLNTAEFKQAKLINHHLAHAYSSFFTSPFEESAIIVIDGAGSHVPGKETEDLRETTTYAYGHSNKIEIFKNVSGTSTGASYIDAIKQSQKMEGNEKNPPLRNNSLGDLYRAITEALGFGFLKAGTTMGLVPYGKDNYSNEIMNYIALLDNGEFRIDIQELNQYLQYIRIRSAKNFGVDADLAYSVQFILETLLTHALEYLWKNTNSDNLCVVGGVGLNSIANSKIINNSNFKNLHIMFSPGDSGTALGSAIWSWFQHNSSSSTKVRFSTKPYLGKKYSDAEIIRVLNDYHLNYTKRENEKVAQLIASGKITAWYQGASEFGPRALGNRSLLADPRNTQTRDLINNIKGREWFRPLAPSVLNEYSNEYFYIQNQSKYMQFAWISKDIVKTKAPAIVHIDSSSRVQTVDREDNPLYYDLINKYYQITGIPLLLNTSLNVGGKPIVETPLDAVATFLNSDIDVLVLEDFLIEKN